MSAKGTEKLVCDDIALRQLKGIAKYHITVEHNPLTELEWLQHFYEELLDAAVYCKRIIEKKKEHPHAELSDTLRKWVKHHTEEAMDHQCENDT